MNLPQPSKMRHLLGSLLVIWVLGNAAEFAVAKKPSRPSRSTSRIGGGATTSRSAAAGASSRDASVSRRQRPPVVEEEDDFFEDDDVIGELPEEAVEDDDEDEAYDEIDDALPRRQRPPPGRRPVPAATRTARGAAIHASGAGTRKQKQRPPPPRRYEDDMDEYEDELDDEYSPSPRSRQRTAPPPPRRRGGPPARRGNNLPPPPRRPGRPGTVVPYARPPESSFSRGLTALRAYVPDPSAVREAAASSLSAARQTTSTLSSNLYREVKGLTSSELEQVMLKATRPDDTAVKGKHVERLVGVTYQISARYDIYDAVLRKLWSKMAEKDWRTTIKALYILHRFAADGAPEHAPALKARLRELRRTRDPKRKDKYFNSKQLLAGDAALENMGYRAFMARYAHYVLLRAQCFGGMFDEIGLEPKAVTDAKKKAAAPPKPITSAALRAEHLDAAGLLLKAGLVCQLKEGEECENTAIASERVASDLIGLTAAVAMALNRALKTNDLKGADPKLLRKWTQFYQDELLPQTRAMVKKTSSKLDAYGLFLPSRMGTSVAPELLQKGLNLPDDAGGGAKSSVADDLDSVARAVSSMRADEVQDVVESVTAAEAVQAPEAARATPKEDEEAADAVDEVLEEEALLDDDYYDEEEEYYDDDEL